MLLHLPEDIWACIERDRVTPDGRIWRGLGPPKGIYLASWLTHFIRGHHDLPISWPSYEWYKANHEVTRANQHYAAPECPMRGLRICLGRQLTGLLKARGEADGASQATILRRLLVQHFGRTPSDPVRVTGGVHVPSGELVTCPDCQALPEYDRNVIPQTGRGITQVGEPWRPKRA